MTDIEKVRLLTGTTASDFSDDEVQAFLDMSDGSLLMSAALLCDSRAAEEAAGAQSVSIGDFTTSNKSGSASFAAQAKAFRELEYNTPAFAFAEPNFTTPGAIQLIRNQILRTLGVS